MHVADLGSMSLKEVCSRLLRLHFPPVNFAFAYGSAVFKQDSKPKGKMLDMVFAVDNPLEWHEENLKRNRHHYSFMGHLGSRGITSLQKLSAGVYYNTLVSVDSKLLKYGVISVSDLMDDLINWRWLYISGRLHKPVLVLTDVDCQLQGALDSNLRSAVLCALLCIKDTKFSAEQLYMAITSLSYQGDFRMIVGEDRNKVRNIVFPNLSHFSELYKLYTDSFLEESANGLLCRKIHAGVDDLPLCVQQGIREGRSVKDAITQIVSESSFKQSAKGVLTAGLIKTIYYSFEKMYKMAQSY